MSRIIPTSLVNALKSQNDIAVVMNGIDCKLYTLLNRDVAVMADAYAEESEKQYSDPVQVPVWIAWDPESALLHKYGLFVEKGTAKPIIARFPSTLEIPEGSYIKVEMRYKPDMYDVDEFEVVNRKTGKTHDEIVLPIYCMAPRRVKKTPSTPSLIPRIPSTNAYA